MKNCYLVFFSFLLLSAATNAQITIGTADLPSANDTFRVSITSPPTGVDFTTTGPNQTWDYSMLMPQSQRVDSFLSLFAVGTPGFLFLATANVAVKASNFNIGGTATGGIGATGTDVINFFRNNSTAYSQTGIAAAFNGLPIPIYFNPQDQVYKFPLNYGDTDTSNSVYTFSLSTNFYFQGRRSRINQVDGWGTITTPYGTRSNVLRVKTTVVERDSVHLDTTLFGFPINQGFNLPTTTTIEYKWLAAGEGVPFLQANTGQNGNVNQIIYRDLRRSLIGVEELDARSGMEIYPNPSSDGFYLSNVNARPKSVAVSMMDMQGRLVLERSLEIAGGGTSRINYDGTVAEGNYIVHLQSGADRWVRIITVAGR
ncbi:MAG: hypothetical protein RL021_1203 [Bacteroidota bacterium]